MIDFDKLKENVIQQLNQKLADSDKMKNPQFAAFATAFNELAADAAITALREYDALHNSPFPASSR